jgi:hypothetical protein
VTVAQRVLPARHLWVGVPAYGGEVKAETALALAGAGVALALAGIEVTFGMQQGCCYLDHTRNMLATAFMRSEATDMLFVDADVGFSPEAVVQIARATRPYVAGVYPMKRDDTTFPVTFDVDELRADAQGLVEAASVPTGFLRLNRAVFEALPVTMYRDDRDNEWMGYFHSGVRHGRYSGEDTDFASRWRSLGGKIYILPELHFTHTGGKAWEGSWGAWMRSRLREAA